MKKQLLSIFLLTLSFGSFAQIADYTRTLNSAGGSRQINNNTYEWSIGEMVLVNTASSSNIIVTQGVLQPSDNVTGIERRSKSLNGITVFPNPTKNILYIQYLFEEEGNWQYELLDVTGKILIRSSPIHAQRTGKRSLDLDQYANGSYILRIEFTNKAGTASSTTYKIDKIN